MNTIATQPTLKETKQAIKAALKDRSGLNWSVTSGRGTARFWIYISAPAARCDKFGMMTDSDINLLTNLLDEPRPVHRQGVAVPSSDDYYLAYIQKAEGRTVTVEPKPYWD